MPKFAPYKSTFNLSTVQVDSSNMKSDQRYDALRNIENHSESDTEVEEWDPEDDAQRHRRRRKRTFWGRVKRYRWMIDTALLVVIFGLLAEKRWKKYMHHQSHRNELGGDVTGFAPKFSQQIVTFKPDPIFAPENASSFWDKKTQHAWLSIVPRGLGYVQVKDPSLYDNLPHPIHDYVNHTVFTTSMTHQLHCLYTILDAYNILSVKNDPSLIEMPWHINHCFEYIRQAIMCAGDVALEGAATSFPPDPVTGEDRGGSDGWDSKHVCKDYSQVYDYLERETIGKDKWISS